jgi:enterochelin esterase family protein
MCAFFADKYLLLQSVFIKMCRFIRISLNKLPLFIAIVMLPRVSVFAQKTAKIHFNMLRTVSDYFQKFQEISQIQDTVLRQKQLNHIWDFLQKHKRIPLVIQDSVMFLYRGNADSVFFVGDFSGWGRNRKFQTKAENLPGTDVWYNFQIFPKDARLDYKVVVNKTNWILDPENPHQQWGGNGPNSELRMPDWKPDENTFSKKNIKKGTLSDNFLLNSKNLGYPVQYKVYTPSGYSKLQNLPVLYVTDGHEYADERMGALINVLDNLIANHTIQPLMAVLIDPRNPDTLDINRRMTELPVNEKYADFVALELVSQIDKTYKTDSSANRRAILGTSLGGLFAAYLANRHSDKFGLAGINSPAFWYREQILDMYEQQERLPLKIYMSTGVVMDTEVFARKMKEILDKKGYPLKYRELNEGHSWGNWRQTLTEMLTYFFNTK